MKEIAGIAVTSGLSQEVISLLEKKVALLIEFITSLTEAERWAYGLIVSAIIALITQRVNHALARSRSREERRIEAGKNLIASFQSSVKVIEAYNGKLYHLSNILGDQSKNQRIIAKEFKRHLSLIKRYRFNKAWEKYCGNNANILDLTQFNSKPQEIQKILLLQIDEILKFAK